MNINTEIIDENKNNSNDEQNSYYQLNKDKIKEQQKTKVTCHCCGRSVRKYQLKQHLKTNICINNRKPPIIEPAQMKSNSDDVNLNNKYKVLFESIFSYLVEQNNKSNPPV